MIVSNELRIGNCINHNNEQCVVFSLSKEWLRVTKDRHIAISYDNISGIPLTEEWLLKFGFEKIVNHKWNDGSETELMFRLEKFCVQPSDHYAIIFRYTRDGGDYISNITMVHQLQNLYFSLTGGELTIQEIANQ